MLRKQNGTLFSGIMPTVYALAVGVIHGSVNFTYPLGTPYPLNLWCAHLAGRKLMMTLMTMLTGCMWTHTAPNVVSCSPQHDCVKKLGAP